MSCVECIYFKMCTKTAITNCPDFDPKSSYIKSPVEVGQTVWFKRDRNSKIEETTVEKIVLKSGGLYIKLACNSMYETSCRSIGKTVFLSKPVE